MPLVLPVCANITLEIEDNTVKPSLQEFEDIFVPSQLVFQRIPTSTQLQRRTSTLIRLNLP